MIFSRQNSEKNLPAPFKISGTKIEHEHETCFLGVIMDEKLTWAKHIITLNGESARYIGIMYKLKNVIPKKKTIQIDQSLYYLETIFRTHD